MTSRTRSVARPLRVVAALSLVAACRRSPTPQPAPETVATSSSVKPAPSPVPSPPAPAPSPSIDPAAAKAAFDANVIAAKKFPPQSMWANAFYKTCGQAGLYEVPGKPAAILRYVCTSIQGQWLGNSEAFPPAGCVECFVEGARLVGASPGNIIDEQDVQTEVVWSSRGGLWDLYGEGRVFAVLHVRSYDIGQLGSSIVVYKFDGTRWKSNPSPLLKWAPNPFGEVDVDGDGTTELLVRRWAVPLEQADVDGCTPSERAGFLNYKVSTQWIPEDHPYLRLDGVVKWNGASYADNLPSFRKWYEARVAKGTATKGSATCGLVAVRAAAEVYVARRVLGDTDAAATVVADKVTSFEDSIPGSWNGVREALAKETYPALPGGP